MQAGVIGDLCEERGGVFVLVRKWMLFGRRLHFDERVLVSPMTSTLVSFGQFSKCLSIVEKSKVWGESRETGCVGLVRNEVSGLVDEAPIEADCSSLCARLRIISDVIEEVCLCMNHALAVLYL